jgi:long-chain fatty acid transport protein
VGALALAALASTLLLAPEAGAAGLYFSDRGVRPLSRGGAFIAGADDLGAITYNPAGLMDAGGQLFLDASWLHFTSNYTRQALVRQSDPNTGEPRAEFIQTMPEVEGSSPVLPIPTLAASYQPHEKVVLALGAWAPYSAITTYPSELDGEPSPQRYSLITLDGSALAVLGAYVAVAPVPELRLGAGFELLAGTFSSSVVFSGCVPDRFACAPEQPEWDTASELKVGPIAAPSGRFGAIWEVAKGYRVGAAFALPIFVRSGATIRTRLPATPFFERASQSGDEADVSFDLPWTLRAGVEARPVPELRVEAGFGLEKWSMHDTIDVEPSGVALKNVALFPETYYIPDVVFPRHFQDSYSGRLGAEYSIELGGYPIDLRAGLAYETSAVPAEYLSVLTIDANKFTTAIGGGLHIGEKIRLDATYAHIFAADVTVDPRDAKIPQVSPVRANPTGYPDYVNGGEYSARADVLGVGIVYRYEAVKRGEAEPAAR